MSTTVETTAAGRIIGAERRDDGVWVVTFDREGSSANVFDRRCFARLNEVLDEIERDGAARGVVFTSGKPSIFIAGADIHEISRAGSDEELASFLDAGQQAFQRVAALRPTTVAAIHGACLGGGCELALACDARVASDSSKTRIGLPEVMLGIIPAWGGCTRLPRLVGLPVAMDLILGGKRLPAGSAKKRGLVDRLVARRVLVDAAARLALSGAPSRKGHALVNSAPAAAIIASKARKATLARTRGHYPAVTAAIDVVAQAPRSSVADSLKREREAILELARTEACRSLIGVFLLQERAKNLAPADALPGAVADVAAREADVDRTAVIGAGVMGAGIAQWLAARGHPVLLRDIDDDKVRGGLQSIAKVFAGAAKRRIISRLDARDGLDRIRGSAREVPLHAEDLVVEAAVEHLPIKQQIFRRLEQLSRPGTILATNTSALSIDAIADGLEHPGRVIGLHFFNPVHRMQLVEIVVGRRTSPEVAARMLRFVQQIGKLPVVTADTPGFLVNRVLMPYLVEAGLLFEGGCEPKEIDEAMLDFGMPMGPLRLIDEVGIDVANHVASFLGETYSDRMPVPKELGRMAEKGLLGRKSGAGFYVYRKGAKGQPPINDALLAMRSSGPLARLSRAQMQQRMVLLMVNEAARCLEEQVVRSAEDVDLAMVMGTGFAPFRGGPLRYADTAGLPATVEALESWARGGDARFVPNELLRTKAETNDSFRSGLPGA